MNFSLAPDQISIQRAARDFAEREIAPVAHAHDESGEFPHAVVAKAFDAGLMYVNVPESLGGAGVPLLDETICQEELARGCAGIALAMTISNIPALGVLMAGDEAQRRRFVGESIARRALMCYCLTEPGAGSDVKAIRTNARKVGDEYVLNGSKCFITAGDVAARHLVFAYTDASLGHRGISAFCIPADREGVRVGPSEKKMGQTAAHVASISYQDVRVAKDELLGGEGAGFKLAMEVFNRSRPTIAATAVGIARRAMELALDYSLRRESMGAPIFDHQAIAFKLADMDIRIAAARHLVRESAWMIDEGIDNRVACARAKCFAGDVCMEATTEAVQIFGGYGYMREYPVEKLMRDAKVTQIYEGTAEVQRLIVSRALAAEAGR